jgi:hypothetical protein
MWFELDTDALANDEGLAKAQRELKAIFPQEYVQFLQQYGGGYFAFSNVFSVQDGSHWNVVSRQQKFKRPDNFIAISDNEAGDYYGFLTENGSCKPAVYFCEHEENDSLKKTPYINLFDYLIDIALKN